MPTFFISCKASGGSDAATAAGAHDPVIQALFWIPAIVQAGLIFQLACPLAGRSSWRAGQGGSNGSSGSNCEQQACDFLVHAHLRLSKDFSLYIFNSKSKFSLQSILVNRYIPCINRGYPIWLNPWRDRRTCFVFNASLPGLRLHLRRILRSWILRVPSATSSLLSLPSSRFQQKVIGSILYRCSRPSINGRKPA